MGDKVKPFQIVMEYNPYKDDKRMAFKNPATNEEISSDNTSMHTFLKKDPTLQHEIDGLCEILKKYSSGCTAGLEVSFCGLDSDLEYIRNYAFSHGFETLKFKKGDYELTPVPEAMESIRQEYQKLQSIFKEGKNNDAFKALEDFESAQNPLISICVTGTYSSGKSAFINALIGEEILPSDDCPTTARIYRVLRCNEDTPASIKLVHGCKTLDFTFDNDNQYACSPFEENDEIICKWVNEMKQHQNATKAERIYFSLKLFNDLANEKDTESNPKYDIKDLMEVQVPFIRSILPWDTFDFEIYDTPGTNSSSHQEHFKTFTGILKKLTNGLPVIVTTNKMLDSTDTEKAVEELKTNGGNLDLGNVLVVVNQADQSSMEKLKELATKESCMTQWKSRLFFISSIIGLGGKKESIGNFVDENYEFAFEDYQKRFISPSDKRYTQLFLCNVLNGKDTALNLQEDEKRATADGADQRTMLLHNSGLWAVEHEIGNYAQNFALYNKCRQSRQYLDKAIQIIQDQQRAVQECMQRELGSLVKEFDEAKQQMFDELEGVCINCQEQYVKKYIKDMKAIQQFYFIKLPLALDQDVKRQRKVVKKGKGHSRQVLENINKFIQEFTLDFQRKANNFSQSFWKDAEKEYKDSCTKVVIGSDALTEYQKEYLSQFILRFPSALYSPYLVPACEELVLDKKIFGLKIGEKLNIIQYKITAQQAILKTLTEYTLGDCQDRTDRFIKWTQALTNAFKSEAADWNPALREKGKAVTAMENQLKGLQCQVEKACAAKSRINKLLEFKTVKTKEG